MFIDSLMADAIACSLFGYVLYFRDTVQEAIAPNKWSWLIWSAAATVEAFTYSAINPGQIENVIFFVSAGFCVAITIGVWSRSKWERPDWTEIVCVLASVAALVLWLVLEMNFWAHILMVISIPVGFIPTWRSTKEHQEKENSTAWIMWTIGDALTFLVIVRDLDSPETELPYIVTEFLCHASVWVMVSLKMGVLSRGGSK